MRARTLPRDAVIERKIFKAEKNSTIPAGDALSSWFGLLVKPVVAFAIALSGQKVKLTAKKE